MSGALVETIAGKLGILVRSQAELAHKVQERLPLKTLTPIVKAGISPAEVRLIIPDRTLRHRAEKNQPLTVEEPDRVVRLMRIQTIAEQTFEDKEKANQWLRRPLSILSGKSPLDLSQTEAGGRVVENVLAKIAWGAAA